MVKLIDEMNRVITRLTVDTDKLHIIKDKPINIPIPIITTFIRNVRSKYFITIPPRMLAIDLTININEKYVSSYAVALV